MFLLVAGIGMSSFLHAQHYAYRNPSNPIGVNGFRTVAEENALMEQMITEKRKKEKEESDAARQDIKAETRQPARNTAPVTENHKRSPKSKR